MRTRVIDHPLVAHKLTLLRERSTPSPVFRQLVDELSEDGGGSRALPQKREFVGDEWMVDDSGAHVPIVSAGRR